MESHSEHNRLDKVVRLQSPAIIHLAYGRFGDWRLELDKISNCIAVVHADEVTRDDLVTVLDQLQSKGIKLALEPARRKYPTRPNCTLKEIAPIIEGLPKDIIGICYDTAHGRIANESITELEPFVDRLFCMHFCDSQDLRCSLPIGSGEVDVDAVLSFLREYVNHNFPIIYERE